MVKKEFIISLIGGIWALSIFLSSSYGWFFFNYFNYSYLIIGGGSIVGVIVGLRYDEKIGILICLWSCIGFVIFQIVITWGNFFLYWIFLSGGANYAPLGLVLIGSIIGYIDSRKINKNLVIKKEGQKILTRGLILSLIGGIVSWFMILSIYPTFYYDTYLTSLYLILTWGAIIGVGVSLVYNKKVGSIICISSGIIYILYFAVISKGFVFLYLIEPLSYNLTPFLLVLVGGIIGYSELRGDMDGSDVHDL